MMKNKYINIQICWYVHSDISSRSFRVGHCKRRKTIRGGLPPFNMQVGVYKQEYLTIKLSM